MVLALKLKLLLKQLTLETGSYTCLWCLGKLLAKADIINLDLLKIKNGKYLTIGIIVKYLSFYIFIIAKY